MSAEPRSLLLASVECSVTPYSSVGRTLYRVVPAGASRTIGPVTPPAPAGPRDRAPVPRDPPPARAAALAAAGAGVASCAWWTGSARSSSTRSRSPVGTTTSCWLARIAGYRRAWTDGLLYADARALRDLQQGPLHRPDRRAAVVPDHLGPRAAESRRSRRSTSTPPLVEELLGPDPARGAAGLDRLRAARRDRLVLAADQPGPGDPRGARRGGHPRARPARRQPPGLRPRRAPVPGRAPRRAGPPSATSAATSCCRATAPTACSGARGAAELWSGIGPAESAARPATPARAPGGARRGRGPRPGERRGRPRRAVHAAARDAACSTAPRRRCRRRDPASRSSRRSIRSSGTATSCARCTTSTTSGRSTSRPPSGAGATTCCRSCSATGSSAGSSRGSTGEPGTLRVLDLWWEDGFDPLAEPGFVEALTERWRRTRGSASVGRIVLPRAARHRPLASAIRARLGTRGRIRG